MYYLSDDTSNINVYVGDDSKIHFVDKEGADTVLPFSKGSELSINLLDTYTYNGMSSNHQYKFSNSFEKVLVIAAAAHSYEGNTFANISSNASCSIIVNNDRAIESTGFCLSLSIAILSNVSSGQYVTTNCRFSSVSKIYQLI